MYHARLAMKYLSKFTKEYTSFRGWRLALKRGGVTFVRYFSALELGGMQQAEAEARRVRAALLRDLERAPEAAAAEIFARYRKAQPELPRGLRPPQGQAPAQPPAPLRSCTLKCNEVCARLLDEVARQWGIDHPSALRAALYLFMAWSRQQGDGAQGARRLVDFLARQGEVAGLPPFSVLFAPKRG